MKSRVARPGLKMHEEPVGPGLRCDARRVPTLFGY